MKTKIIIKAELARKLLKKGYRIIDIKARRENTDATVFVFQVEGGFIDDFYALLKESE